jgi:hypothetical protein
MAARTRVARRHRAFVMFRDDEVARLDATSVNLAIDRATLLRVVLFAKDPFIQLAKTDVDVSHVNRAHRVPIWLTSDELRALDESAARLGVDRSKYVRLLIFGRLRGDNGGVGTATGLVGAH